MEAKEFRIGNAIWLVDKNKAYVIQDGHDIDECENNEMVKPIQLTEEKLLKCGFENIVDGNFWDKNICIHVSKDGLYILTEQRRVYVKYLHQLQNLYFALTGEELDTSKLF